MKRRAMLVVYYNNDGEVLNILNEWYTIPEILNLKPYGTHEIVVRRYYSNKPDIQTTYYPCGKIKNWTCL